MAQLIEKIKAFIKTPKGKMAIVFGGVGVGFIIVLFLVYVILGGNVEDQEQLETKILTDAPIEETKEPTVTIVPLSEGFEVYGFKDPFEPLTKEEVEEEEEGEEVDISAVISLKGISFVEGEPVAQLLYNGSVFEAGEGETVSDSPYLILEIMIDKAKLLYGDDIITLSLGEDFVGKLPEEDSGQ
ncbi:MAG: hypothetical protein KAS39_01555 [Actinomycetia bacterium]|nr:hypothetical protein [Actinomycetes bacterium]